MILGGYEIFEEAKAVTVARITDYLDLGSLTEAGRGSPKFINVYVDTAFSSDTETIQIDLITSSGVPTAGYSMMTVLMPTAVDSISGLHQAGRIAKVPLPSEGLERYVALSYVVPTEVATGKFTAFLSLD